MTEHKANTEQVDCIILSVIRAVLESRHFDKDFGIYGHVGLPDLMFSEAWSECQRAGLHVSRKQVKTQLGRALQEVTYG